MNKVLIISILAILLVNSGFVAAVAADFQNLDPNCWETTSSTGEGVAIYFGSVPVVVERTELIMKDTCSKGNEIDFGSNVNLVLGAIQEDEVIINNDSIYVDSVTRPDLDVPAKITFRNQPFAVQPNLLKDGSACNPPDCVIEQYVSGELIANVSGFSNYTLTGRQDFTVYSDEAPELQGKVYQVIDLGSTYRSDVFSCVVMIFALDKNGEQVLVQTNPEREVQGRMFGDTDQQQPESLGYFPTTNGVANVYFRNDLMVGYNDFQYVAQCQNNATQLIYEETIIPVYAPLGREVTARALWLMDEDGSNAFYGVFYFFGFLIVFSLLMMFIRRARRR